MTLQDSVEIVMNARQARVIHGEQRIPFHDGEIIVIDVDGEPHVALKPAVEALGLNFSKQLRKLKSMSWACVALRAMQLPGDSQRREHTVVDIDTLLMFLATVNENNVALENRELLVMYQREVAKAIRAYWTGGTTVKPTPHLDLLHDVQQAIIEVRGIAIWLEARAAAIEGQDCWCSAREYAEANNLDTSHRSMKRLGRQAAAIARANGVTASKVPNHGKREVNRFPKGIWEEAADLVQQAALTAGTTV